MFGVKRKDKEITVSTPVWLTENGRKIAAQFGAKGKGGVVIYKLHEHNGMSVGELADETHYDTEDVKQIVRILENQEIVRTRSMEL